jgi:hypothetical protein
MAPLFSGKKGGPPSLDGCLGKKGLVELPLKFFAEILEKRNPKLSLHSLKGHTHTKTTKWSGSSAG